MQGSLNFIKKHKSKLIVFGAVAAAFVIGFLTAGTAVDAKAGSGGKTGSTGTIPQAISLTPDSREPLADELFTATDGSNNYMRSAIPANPVIASNSASLVALMGANTPRLNGPQWQITVYGASNADPVYHPSLSYAKSWGCSVGAEGIHIPNYATRELPANGDGWISVYNRDDGTVKSIWQASKSSSGVWKGSCGGVWKANSGGGSETKVTGVGTGAEVQAGFGFIQNNELLSGTINHALYFTSTATCKTGFKAPAGKTDGSSTGTCVTMGSRLQLDPSVNCDTLSGASTGEKMICHAMQTYGGYILDSGGPGPISGIGIAGDDLTDAARMPWQTPGNGMRGTRGCAPVSSTCGIVTNLGLDGTTAALSHIPWNQVRFLNSWNGQ